MRFFGGGAIYFSDAVVNALMTLSDEDAVKESNRRFDFGPDFIEVAVTSESGACFSFGSSAASYFT